MAKTTGPLLSLRARGQIAKTLVYANWRGIPYARTYVIPQNPRTADQLQTRQAFELLNAAYAGASPAVLFAYSLLTKGRPLTERNRWVQLNLAAIRSDADTTDLIVNPGQTPIPAPVNPSITGGVGTITGAADDQAIPPGFVSGTLYLVAFQDSDPNSPGPYPSLMYQAEDVLTPFAPTLTSLDPGDYHAALFWTNQADPPTNGWRTGRSFDQIVTVT